MPSYTSCLLYSYAYISSVIMAESIDSSYHTQFGTMVEPGQDLELEHLSTFYVQVPEEVSLPGG